MATEVNGRFPLAYLGVSARNPSSVFKHTVAPTSADYKNFHVGAVWIYNDKEGTTEVYMLVDKSLGVSTWLKLG